MSFKEDGPKIAYLQAEYTTFLRQRKMEMIAEHFRFNRTFMPVTLQVALTAHALNAILPQYAPFEVKMDAPTRKVSRSLKQKPKHFPKHLEELFIKKLDEFHAFNLMVIEKRYQADNQIGSVWVAERDKSKERENLVMSLLLLYEQ